MVSLSCGGNEIGKCDEKLKKVCKVFEEVSEKKNNEEVCFEKKIGEEMTFEKEESCENVKIVQKVCV